MFALLSMAGGCTSVQEILPLPGEVEEEPLPMVEENGHLEQLLTYFDLALRMSKEEVEREYAVQHKLLSPAVCNEPRLLTAMLLMNPSLKLSGKGKDAALLQPCLDQHEGKSNLEYAKWARILQVLLREKKALQTVRRKLVAAKYRINVLKEQNEGLNEKLEELKRIEDSIRERE